MRPEKIAVDVEVDVRELVGMTPEQQARHVIGLTKHKADEVAAGKGGYVRTDRLPEITIKKGSQVLTGVDMLLVHIVWHAEVPDGAAVPGPEEVL